MMDAVEVIKGGSTDPSKIPNVRSTNAFSNITTPIRFIHEFSTPPALLSLPVKLYA